MMMMLDPEDSDETEVLLSDSDSESDSRNLTVEGEPQEKGFLEHDVNFLHSLREQRKTNAILGGCRSWFIRGKSISVKIVKIYKNNQAYSPSGEVLNDIVRSHIFDNHEDYNQNFCGSQSSGLKIATVDSEMSKFMNEKQSSIHNRVNWFRYLYEIEVTHECFKWIILRRHIDFRRLHESVMLHITRSKLIIKKKRSTSGKKMEILGTEPGTSSQKVRIPTFPMRPDIFISIDQINHRVKALENYLQTVANIRKIRKNIALCKFLEISPVSFISVFGARLKEGFVKKQNGLRYKSGSKMTNVFKKRFSKRWLFLKETCIGYLRPKSCWELGDVALFDNQTYIAKGKYFTGMKNGIMIQTSGRILRFACLSNRHMVEWFDAISEVTRKSAIMFIRPMAFDSFAPRRQNVYTKWFVDGHGYFNDLANALMHAQREIFMTGWWLIPDYHLKRPLSGDKWKLDNILYKKASQGVRIYILLYKEITFCLNLNSLHCKNYFKQLHPNIQVIRHPDHYPGGILLWANHEKLCIVDQKICFFGGLDICLGRWDLPTHPISDCESNRANAGDWPLNGRWKIPVAKGEDDHVETFKPSSTGTKKEKKGKKAIDTLDSCQVSCTGQTLKKPTKHIEEMFDIKWFGTEQTLERDFYPSPDKNKRRFTSLLSHEGNPVVNKLSPVQRLFSVKNQEKKKSKVYEIEVDDEETPPLLKTAGYSVHSKASNDADPQLTNSHDSQSQNTGLQRRETLWIGQDYVNWNVKEPTIFFEPNLDSIDRQSIPRMPWHDIACVVYGRTARDFARHFIQRWNSLKTKKFKKDSEIPFLLPLTYSQSFLSHSFLNQEGIQSVNVQAIRSSSPWSAGLGHIENSIYRAYIYAISNAKHYIYMENQFFISSCSPQNQIIQNAISQAIYEKILSAKNRNQNFRVYLVLPLLPAFEAKTSIYAILHYLYMSLFRGEKSLFHKLRLAGIDPEEYIFVTGLRKYCKLADQWQTEMIYVHSKLLIVDDCISIIGSANINDRSMLGSRDSEVALYIEDKEFISGYLGGQPCDKIGLFNSSLRVALMREHLGVPFDYKLQKRNKLSIKLNDHSNVKKGNKYKLPWDYNLLGDPVHSAFFENIWKKTAVNNTEIYQDVFNCLPNNEIRTFNQLRQSSLLSHLARDNPQLAEEKLKKINGYIVLMPRHFLEGECLEPKAGTGASLLPNHVWS